MAYCTTDDVYNQGVHGGKVYTTTTNPTLAQVQEKINIIAREIDSMLYGAGVSVVPVLLASSPKAYALLKDLNAQGAALEAEAVNWKSWSTDFVKMYIELRKSYRQKFNSYRDYPALLMDASLGDGHAILESVEGEIMTNTIIDKYDYSEIDDAEAESIEPLFRMSDIW